MAFIAPTSEAPSPAADAEAVVHHGRRGMRYLLLRVGLVQPSGLALAILTAQMLSSAKFGALGLATALISSSILLADLGLGAAVARSNAEHAIEEQLEAAFSDLALARQRGRGSCSRRSSGRCATCFPRARYSP